MSIFELRQMLSLMRYRIAYRYRFRIKQIPFSEVTRNLLNKEVHTTVSLFDEIADKIERGVPMIFARLGNTEGIVTGEYIERKLGIRNHYDAIWIKWLFTTSGFFADDYEDREVAMDRYAQMTLDGIEECDYLSAFWPSRVYMPFFFKYYALKCIPTDGDFGPYFDIPIQKTWLRALKGKRVLIINSFTDSIKYQYKRKNKLVKSSEFELPDFELLTYKTCVTQAGERVDGYNNFFSLLDKMIKDIKSIDFDVALIGAGAYGFPIAVEVKRMGKIALETCGNTPLFFGVYGERAVEQGVVKKHMTDAWIRPMEEPPKQYKKIERGCYW